MLPSPITYYQDNLVFGPDQSCWAIYEMIGFDYDMRPAEEKKKILRKTENFLSSIAKEALIMVLPVEQNLDDYFSAWKNELMERYKNAMTAGSQKEDALIYNAGTEEYSATRQRLYRALRENGMTNDYQTFLAVELQGVYPENPAESLKAATDYLMKRGVNLINRIANADTYDIEISKLRAYQQEETRVCATLKSYLPVFAVDSDTTRWLIQRSTYRGLHQDAALRDSARQGKSWNPDAQKVCVNRIPYLRPQHRAVERLFDGVIDRKIRHIQINQDDGKTSYQAFLAIGAIPKDMGFPDCEWIYHLQELNLRAELYLHTKTIEHRPAEKMLDTQAQKVKAQTGEIISSGESEMPKDIYDSKQDVDGLRAGLSKTADTPLIEVSATICVSADNKEEMEAKVSNILNDYRSKRFAIHWTHFDQWNLFYQCIPGTRVVEPDYKQRLLPVTLAAGIIGATSELGDPGGLYVGTTGVQGKNVFISQALACRCNQSGVAALVGMMGGGKSSAMNTLICDYVKRGAYALLLDPKGERKNWKEQLPSISGLITIVSLSAEDKDCGKLDPFNIYRAEPEEATSLAESLLVELFELAPSDERHVALLEALQKLKTASKPSMMTLADILDSFDPEDDLCHAARLMARQIRLQRNLGLARLFIGTGDEEAVRLENRLNILQVQNLKLPDAGKKRDQYTAEEKLSVVIMMVLTSFSKRFLHSHPQSFKVLGIDEFWMLKNSKEGEELISYAARMSRSLYAALILNGHTVLDLPNEGVSSNVNYKFCFHTDDTEEAKRILKYIGQEPSEKMIAVLRNLRAGQCLFRDRLGRVGLLSFDMVLPEYRRAFDTTPGEEAEIKEA